MEKEGLNSRWSTSVLPWINKPWRSFSALAQRVSSSFTWTTSTVSTTRLVLTQNRSESCSRTAPTWNSCEWATCSESRLPLDTSYPNSLPQQSRKTRKRLPSLISKVSACSRVNFQKLNCRMSWKFSKLLKRSKDLIIWTCRVMKSGSAMIAFLSSSARLEKGIKEWSSSTLSENTLNLASNCDHLMTWISYLIIIEFESYSKSIN